MLSFYLVPLRENLFSESCWKIALDLAYLFIEGKISGGWLCVEIEAMATLTAKLELRRVAEAAPGADLFQLSATF
jgi:hypothetical protein